MRIPKFIKTILGLIPGTKNYYSVTYSVPNVPGTVCGGINGSISHLGVLKVISEDDFTEELYQALKQLLGSPGMVTISMTSGKKVIPIIYFGMNEPLPLTCEIRELATGRVCTELAQKIIKKWNDEYPKLREELGYVD
ncbi:MAG: hypothetical protein WCG20_03165 [bacterium]